MEINAMEMYMAKKMPRKKKTVTRQERYAKEATEALKEFRTFELNGKETYYKGYEDLELMYFERMHTAALAQVHLRDDADKEHFVRAWSLALTTAMEEAEQIQAQMKKELETVYESVEVLQRRREM
jgi:hypothetical protein